MNTGRRVYRWWKWGDTLHNILEQIETYARQRLKEDQQYRAEHYNTAAIFHYRREHVETVVGLADTLSQTVQVNRDICIIGAWLHDLGKCYSPLFSKEENEQREQHHGHIGALEAREFLTTLPLDQDFIREVCLGIQKHVGLSRKDTAPMKPLSAAVIWDADKLSKIGITGWFHYLVYTVEQQESATLLSLVQQANVEVMEDILNHFNTEQAKNLARERLTMFNQYRKVLEQQLKGEQ